MREPAYGKQNQVHPLTFCRQRDTRLLSSDFQAGDVLIFSMFTLHGSLENNSPAGQVRLSCDVRYQPAADPAVDGRYFGPSPTGSKGGGYADMRGARPLADS
jgi:ectoine hydroxylase-related dioxygenase (phytanoyl-CoA dioxygenase family)